MTYSTLRGLQCIVGRFRTEVAIFKFSRERFTLVSLRILKHGDPVGDQRFVSLFCYIYLNKLCLSSASNDVITHAQYGTWVIKWAPFLRFGVTFVHANLCMHIHLSRFWSLSAILNSSRRCRFSPKLCFFPNLIRCGSIYQYFSSL